MTQWIVIPGWDKFQHYKDRRPPWLKDYVDQIDRDEYRALSPTARALLPDVRRLYALGDGVVRREGAGTRLGMKLRREHWEELSDAGFIEIRSSKPHPLRYARDRDRDRPSKSSNNKPRGARVTGWRIVRGSHGMTTIPDPNGTDPAPTIGRPL